jgi:phosphoglycolate phosphatase
VIELVCCDMAGTTVRDDGLVLEAFARTLASLDLDEDEAVAARHYVEETMGQSKIEVFTSLFADRAEDANRLFEAHFLDAVRERGVGEVPGARDAIEDLKSHGIRVALTTGFSPETREALIRELAWEELVDLRVSPADAGRGRPAPDMLLVCALRARVSAMDRVAIVGDTASDMEAGRRAGVGRRIGVLTGTDDEHRLLAHGADTVVSSVVHAAHQILADRSR